MGLIGSDRCGDITGCGPIDSWARANRRDANVDVVPGVPDGGNNVGDPVLADRRFFLHGSANCSHLVSKGTTNGVMTPSEDVVVGGAGVEVYRIVGA